MKKIFICYFQKESSVSTKFGYSVIYNSLNPPVFIFSLCLLITSVLIGILGLIITLNHAVKLEKKYWEIKNSKDYTDYDWDNIFVEEGLTKTYLSEEKYTRIKTWINNVWKYQLMIIFIYVCIMLFFILKITLD
jgi:hypothetical protein